MINILLLLAICWILTCIHILDRRLPQNIKVQLLFTLLVTGWAGMLYYWATRAKYTDKSKFPKEDHSAILCVDII
ncbi:MAG: hypothetical protein AAF824_10520 [Bacteroidota bacterium]